MKHNIISSFAAGILVATAISGGVYFSTKSEASSANATETEEVQTTTEEEKVVQTTPTVEEMQEILSTSGYVVQTKEEVEAADAEWKKKVEEAESSNNGNVVYRTMISVTNGMTSIDVGNALKSANIISQSAFEFSKQVEDKGVANYLKPGSYEIDSTMSTDKIISTIFKKQ